LDRFKPYITTPDNAEKIADWLRNRGGIAIRKSLDLNRALQIIATPVNPSEGEHYYEPVCWADSAPACIITDPADVLILKPESQPLPLLDYLATRKKPAAAFTGEEDK
jgi:hypothetical protein